MHVEHRESVTTLLERAEADETGVLAELVPLVYDELRAMAHRQLRREGQATLQTTELVHEAYERLLGSTQVTKRGRSYFFAAAARAMRQVLVGAARRRGRHKRGGGAEPLTLDEQIHGTDAFAADLVDLDDALERLAGEDPRSAQVVELRYFGGLSVAETAEALDVAERTVKRDWAWARAWLYRELG